ncbi:hypothetical protein ES332_D08G178000v1 [Gossypium tomentosum]|uniref:Arginyl-tRNA synthetase catalytic core domain-containing protein n=1 Tax=Gossypium tomentosum TaxID=34277 RepID=A0A5D2JWC3_GOSTO|nr:hypothetical protein ES332_D08G178000v1 [Gossypium tomentosum]
MLSNRLTLSVGSNRVVLDEVNNNALASEQEAAKRAGWLPQGDNYPKASHVGFGLVLGEDGKRFQTCNTEVVRLVDLLDEAKNRSKAALIEHGKGEQWTEEEIESTADAVGYGAVKYADLKNNRLTNYTLNFDQMLNDEKAICKESQESKIPPSLLFSDKF